MDPRGPRALYGPERIFYSSPEGGETGNFLVENNKKVKNAFVGKNLLNLLLLTFESLRKRLGVSDEWEGEGERGKRGEEGEIKRDCVKEGGEIERER